MKTRYSPDSGTLDTLRGSLRTLIVDDSALFVTRLLRLLDTDARIEVVGTAADGNEAIQKAEELSPDLILMDLNMPCLDGLKATTLLRSRLPDTRIIIMTVHESVTAQAASRAHGADGFVGKIGMTKTLMAEIRRVLLSNPANGGITR